MVVVCRFSLGAGVLDTHLFWIDLFGYFRVWLAVYILDWMFDIYARALLSGAVASGHDRVIK